MDGGSSNEKIRKSTKSKPKKKRKLPTSFLDGQTLELVSSFGLPSVAARELLSSSSSSSPSLVHTPVASVATAGIFYDRFVKEVVNPYRWSSESAPQNGCTLRPSTGTAAGAGGGGGGNTVQYVMVNGRLVQKKTTLPNKATPINQCKKPNGFEKEAKRVTSILWKERIVMGTNQCSRVLERLSQGPTMTLKKDKIKKRRGSSKNDEKLNVDDPIVSPSLIVLARDIYPPTMLSHVPSMARRYGIPLLLLPGRSSIDLGKALKARKTSILFFVHRNNATGNGDVDQEQLTNGGGEGMTKNDIGNYDNSDMAADADAKLKSSDVDHHHAKIDSFVQYITEHIIPS